MDEAEVYGSGLERGRAANVYIDNREQMQVNLITHGPQNNTVSVGETAVLKCEVSTRATTLLWIKGLKFSSQL